MKKGTAFQSTELADTDEQVLPEGVPLRVICSSGDPLTANQVHGDHNDYVAYVPVDALEGSEVSEDGIHWVKQEYIDTMFWSDSPTPRVRPRRPRSR